MNRLIKYSPLWLLLLLLIPTGCREESTQQPEPEPSITLSKTEVTLPREGASETLAVSMPEGEKWSYMLTPQVDWLTVSEGTDQAVVLTATANEGTTDRAVTVNLFVGGRSARVLVSQTAADLLLDLPESSITLTPTGERRSIRLSTNSQSWSVAPVADDARWLTVETVPAAGMIYLSASRNTTQAERSTVLTVTSAKGEEKKLEVKQSAPLVHFTPYQDPLLRRGIPWRDLIDYEEARGFAFTFMQQGSLDGLMPSPDVISFKTTSDRYPYITYFRDLRHDNIYESARIEVTDPEDLRMDGDYMKYLLSIGYKPAYGHQEDNIHLISPDGYFTVTTTYSRTTDHFYVVFTPEYLQSKDMPTFDTLPVGPKGFLDRIDAEAYKYPAIKTWETETLGSKVLLEVPATFDPKRPDDLYSAIFSADKTKSLSPEDYRWYILYFSYPDRGINPGKMVQSVSEGVLLFTDVERLLFYINYSSDPRQVKFKTTRELEKLLADNGYTYAGITGGVGMKYVNESLGYVIHIGLMSFKDVDPKQDYVALLRYSRLPKESPESDAAETYAVAAASSVVSSFVPLRVSK